MTTVWPLWYIGARGGYYDAPEYSLNIENKSLPYYYIDKQIIPKKLNIEEELCKSYRQEFQNCINNIDKKIFNLTYARLNPKCRIFPKKILFETNSNIKIEQGKYSAYIRMQDFPLEYNSHLGNIINLSGFIVKQHDDNSICITCISNLAGEFDLYVNSFSLKNSSNLFIISENKTSDKPYYFLFLSKTNKFEEETNKEMNIPMMPYAGFE